jgi:hypothetical protein
VARTFLAETDQHRRLRDAVWSALGSWRRFVIAIDGVDGAGKSSLGRYLAWQLEIPLIQTDLFLVPEAKALTYRQECLWSIVDYRLAANRPAIIEGVCILRLLQHLTLKADYLIWVDSKGHDGSRSLSSTLDDYRAAYKPSESANFVFEWNLDSPAGDA